MCNLRLGLPKSNLLTVLQNASGKRGDIQNVHDNTIQFSLLQVHQPLISKLSRATEICRRHPLNAAGTTGNLMYPCHLNLSNFDVSNF